MDQECRHNTVLDEPQAETETVWPWYDETIPRTTDDPQEPHWSNEMTQPLQPQWPLQMPVAAQSDAMSFMLADWRRHAMGMARGGGALAVLALSVLLLVILGNGLLFASGAPRESERVAQPASVQSTLTPVHATSRQPHYHQPTWDQPRIDQFGKHHHTKGG